jgi:hypothetical protein
MAPGSPDLTAVKTVCAALSRPFNFMAGIKGRSFTAEELASAGAKRVSLATSLYRAAISGLVNAAREVKDHGTFGSVEKTMATPELNSYITGTSPRGRGVLRALEERRSFEGPRVRISLPSANVQGFLRVLRSPERATRLHSEPFRTPITTSYDWLTGWGLADLCRGRSR